ncbi:MAG: three-Cys-motif partner protein TcmP [Candidatus Sulfotelmatobacter sp.]
MINDAAATPTDDQLVCPEVGGWTEDKHRLVSLYATLFSSGMKEKWKKRVYLELYAGAGYSRVRSTQKIIFGSPLRALTVAHPFDKYIFCEATAENLEALKVRVKRHAPTASVSYIEGDCNLRVADIMTEIPAGSKDDTVLTLCFADPYDIGLKFRTIRTLSSRIVDFLVLLAVYSDANRAYRRYVMEDATKVDEFLGSETWRERWKIAQNKAVPFPKFLAEEFAGSMENLGYLPTPIHKMKCVRSDEKNLRLYYIALFSRKRIAHNLWDEVLKYETDQKQFSWG